MNWNKKIDKKIVRVIVKETEVYVRKMNAIEKEIDRYSKFKYNSIVDSIIDKLFDEYIICENVLNYLNTFKHDIEKVYA